MATNRNLTAAVILAACTLAGQAPPAPDPAISWVASIKPNNDVNARALMDTLPGGRLTATAVTVSALIRVAYSIQDREVAGAQSWFSTRRFDIAAKAEGDPPPSTPLLLRALLRDRFGFQVHRETREVPTFSLVLARSDGKTGPRLIPSSFDCAAYMAAPRAPPEPGTAPLCGARINARDLSARAISTKQLATYLTPIAKRFTMDKTGLKGLYDVELAWTPDSAPADANTVDSSPPSFFTAVQEQLGLKLVSDKGPVEFLVIDHASEPSAN